MKRSGLIALAITIPAAVLVAVPLARGLSPSAAEPGIASVVAARLTQSHYRPRPVDDALSRDWFDAYLSMLDPNRMYFLASDIAEFEPWRTRLDDDILAKRPTLEAAYAIYDRYAQRFDERMAYASSLLDDPPRYNEPGATLEVDRSEAPWPQDLAAVNDLWTRRVAEQILRIEIGETDEEESVGRLRRRYERQRKDAEETDAVDVVEMYLAAFAGVFDPHSGWMQPSRKEDFDIQMADALYGIGAQLRSIDGYVTIEELIPGGPAEQSGKLKAKDRIVAVAQGSEAPVDVVEMRLDKVVRMIRGTSGTEVVLTIKPVDANDPAETRKISLIRDKVVLSRAKAEGEIREVEGATRVGVLNVPSFYADHETRRTGEFKRTSLDVQRILEGWAGANLDAVLIDVRNNSGGYLDQAIELTGLFIDQGPVVQIRNAAGRVESLDDENPGVAWAGPLVVLTNENSASASEIFAGALQDYGRALVVGADATHGKGSVQNLVRLDRDLLRSRNLEAAQIAGSLKFTSHLYFRVNGASTQIKGVEADVTLPSPYQGLPLRESDLDHPLPWEQVPPAKYAAQSLAVDLPRLRANSQARIKGHPEFAWLAEDLAERERLRNQPVSLHLPTRKADADRRKQIDEARDAARRGQGWDGESELDFILDEALAITADFVQTRR